MAGGRLPRPLADRRTLLAAFVAYLVVLLYLTLWPQPDAPGGAIVRVVDSLHALGFSAVTRSNVEIGLNVLLFVPLGVLGLVLWPRLRWWGWALVGVALSGFIEGFQGAFLPGRVSSPTDVVANTAGALLGALAVVVAVREVGATRSGAAGAPPALRSRVLLGLAVVLAIGLALAVFTPTSGFQGGSVIAVHRALREAGAPPWAASTALWERLLNVLLVVPAGLLGGLVRPGWSLVRWGLLGLAASLVVEVVQGTLLPGRDASFSDVAMNGTGMVVGAVLARGWVSLHRYAARRT